MFVHGMEHVGSVRIEACIGGIRFKPGFFSRLTVFPRAIFVSIEDLFVTPVPSHFVPTVQVDLGHPPLARTFVDARLWQKLMAATQSDRPRGVIRYSIGEIVGWIGPSAAFGALAGVMSYFFDLAHGGLFVVYVTILQTIRFIRQF